MRRAWEDMHTKGRIEGRVDAVLTMLRGRGVAVPEAARQLILAQTELPRLQLWLERAIAATSIDEVIGDRAGVRSAKAHRPARSRERTVRRPQRAASLR
jgi:hypothetical protein